MDLNQHSVPSIGVGRRFRQKSINAIKKRKILSGASAILAVSIRSQPLYVALLNFINRFFLTRQYLQHPDDTKVRTYCIRLLAAHQDQLYMNHALK